MASKFALVIANTEYTDAGFAQLIAPGKDAKELGRVLDSREICAFDDVILLINENAAKVGETIDYFFSLKKPDDLLILYFSGHGVRDEYGSLYLAVKNTNRDRLRSTAIKADFIREAMDQSRSRRQVLVLDCCNSGAFAQGTKAEIGGSVGTAKAFEGTGYGRIVLTASDSTQFAWEGDKVIGKDTSNSLFTHFLIKGLEGEADQDGDGKITVDELYDYAYEEVVRITPKQTPGKWSYRQQGDLFLRENLKPKDVKPVPLPEDLLDLVTHQNSSVRKVGVQELVALLDVKHLGMVRAVEEKLREIAATDDSLTLRQTASQALSTHGFQIDEFVPAEIEKQKPINKPSARIQESQPLQKDSSTFVTRLKAWIALPKLQERKFILPKLNRRLLSLILGLGLGIVFLVSASRLIVNIGSNSISTPTASVTSTGIATSSRTITPSLSPTVSSTSTRTRTPTPTPTLTPTPTSTKTLLPPFTAKPTRRRNDSGPANSPEPPP